MHAQFCCFVCGLTTPWKLLPKPRVAVWLVESSCATVTKSLKEAIAGPMWVQSTIAIRHCMCVV